RTSSRKPGAGYRSRTCLAALIWCRSGYKPLPIHSFLAEENHETYPIVFYGLPFTGFRSEQSIVPLFGSLVWVLFASIDTSYEAQNATPARVVARRIL